MDNENNEEVVFEEDTIPEAETPKKERGSKLLALVMRLSGGLVKTEKQATYVLIIFIIVVFLGMSWLLMKARGPQPPTPQEIQKEIDLQKEANV